MLALQTASVPALLQLQAGRPLGLQLPCLLVASAQPQSQCCLALALPQLLQGRQRLVEPAAAADGAPLHAAASAHGHRRSQPHGEWPPAPSGHR